MSQENGELSSLECLFCRKVTPVEAAVDGGWVPSFWHNNVEYRRVGMGICPDCVTVHLKFNEEYGDFELLPGHSLPEEKDG